MMQGNQRCESLDITEGHIVLYGVSGDPYDLPMGGMSTPSGGNAEFRLWTIDDQEELDHVQAASTIDRLKHIIEVLAQTVVELSEG